MPWDDIYAMVTPGLAFNMFFNAANVLRDPGPGRSGRTRPRRPGSVPRRPGSVSRRSGRSLMVYGASDLARRLLDQTDDHVRDVFLRDLGAIFPELPGLVTEIEVQRWPEGIPFSAPGRHRSLDRLPLGHQVGRQQRLASGDSCGLSLGHVRMSQRPTPAPSAFGQAGSDGVPISNSACPELSAQAYDAISPRPPRMSGALKRARSPRAGSPGMSRSGSCRRVRTGDSIANPRRVAEFGGGSPGRPRAVPECWSCSK
jgi:hypothetical protein